ncbi:hypothetical protein D3C76_1171670 [compost metagenome]
MLERARKAQLQVQAAASLARKPDNHHAIRRTDQGFAGIPASLCPEGHGRHSAVQIQLPAVFRTALRIRLLQQQIAKRHIRLAVYAEHPAVNKLFRPGIVTRCHQLTRLFQIAERLVVVRIPGKSGP